jgi:hypothetical protein
VADNDLDKLIGAVCTPKEVKRNLGRTARRFLDQARMQNMNPDDARSYIDWSLRKMASDRGYVRFGVNSTVGRLVGKMMVGYEAGYDQLQKKMEKAQDRYECTETPHGRFRYWTDEMTQAFRRQHWGPEPT